jgi:hypothetical protein
MVISSCFVEQSDVAGEVLKLLFDDGGKMAVIFLFMTWYFLVVLNHFVQRLFGDFSLTL